MKDGVAYKAIKRRRQDSFVSFPNTISAITARNEDTIKQRIHLILYV